MVPSEQSMTQVITQTTTEAAKAEILAVREAETSIMKD